MKCTSINDELILEDHIQRVILCGNVSVDSMTTGMYVYIIIIMIHLLLYNRYLCSIVR